MDRDAVKDPAGLAMFLERRQPGRRADPECRSIAADNASSPAWPKGGCPISCARHSASVRSSSRSHAVVAARTWVMSLGSAPEKFTVSR